MQYLVFGDEQRSYKIAILVHNIHKERIEKDYIRPYGLNPAEIIVLSLHRAPDKKKTPATEMKAYIQQELAPVLEDFQVEYLIVADGDYFKTYAGVSKVDAMLGYVLDSKYGPQKLVYVPNFHMIFHDPQKTVDKIRLGIEALKAWIDGSYRDPGIGIIQFAAYPETVAEIASWLKKLQEYPALSCDIEGFSLKHYSAGIGTISFAWSQHEGIAFPVDFLSHDEARQVRAMLKEFFESYRGTLLFHNIAYDAYVLIYQLFMTDLLDNEGLLHGLNVMLRDWHDTKLITYLATNSCAGNRLSLKDQAQEFAGNYAQEDIKDITKIPLPQLLQYNLVDCLSTWFVFKKHWNRMVADQQLEIYENLFKPATLDIIQMQLTGMPVDMARVKEVKALLQQDSDDAVSRMQSSPLVQRFNYRLLEKHTEKMNATWKTKRLTVTEMAEHAKTHEPTRDAVTFNPNSGPKLQALLYDMIGLPVIALTDTKQPATDGATLAALKNHTENTDVQTFLEALVDFKAVDKILTSFIPAMENAQEGPDRHHYLFGNFNLGGTVSGRLSSSDPNLQNLPANSKYAKLIKSCFVAPAGWHLCGIDFASLEDRISALTTRDPQKLKVYTDGYDGHCLRAYAYFGERMPDIDPNSVTSINSIAKKYPNERQASKIPTFALTYDGTFKAIMEQSGLPRETAVKIEQQYHELYWVSDEWKAKKLDQACKDGYVTVAFGLRVRTPLLYQVIRGTSKTPYEAEAEGRTAGNALGQSWCLLNSRAGSEFMTKVRASRFRHDIKPCSQIHDAQYYLVRDDIDAILYANEHVVEACQWQDHPDIWHPEVKLGGEFSIFWPDWSQECVLPNGASSEQVYQAFESHVHKVNK